jgi:hypothetical protein
MKARSGASLRVACIALVVAAACSKPPAQAAPPVPVQVASVSKISRR